MSKELVWEKVCESNPALAGKGNTLQVTSDMMRVMFEHGWDEAIKFSEYQEEVEVDYEGGGFND